MSVYSKQNGQWVEVGGASIPETTVSNEVTEAGLVTTVNGVSSEPVKVGGGETYSGSWEFPSSELPDGSLADFLRALKPNDLITGEIHWGIRYITGKFVISKYKVKGYSTETYVMTPYGPTVNYSIGNSQLVKNVVFTKNGETVNNTLLVEYYKYEGDKIVGVIDLVDVNGCTTHGCKIGYQV